MQTITLYATETMADWEYAYLPFRSRARSSSSQGVLGCYS